MARPAKDQEESQPVMSCGPRLFVYGTLRKGSAHPLACYQFRQRPQVGGRPIVGCDVPHAGRSIRTRGRDVPSVRAEGRVPDSVRVSTESRQKFAGVYVPQMDVCLPPRVGGNQSSPVFRE